MRADRPDEPPGGAPRPKIRKRASVFRPDHDQGRTRAEKPAHLGRREIGSGEDRFHGRLAVQFPAGIDRDGRIAHGGERLGGCKRRRRAETRKADPGERRVRRALGARHIGQGQVDAENGAQAGRAADLDPRAEGVGETIDDGEPQTDAPILAGVGRADLFERVEKPAPIGLGDAGARIEDGISDAAGNAGDIEQHAAALGEFERIADKVEQDLLDPTGIAAGRSRRVGAGAHRHIQTCGMGAGGEKLDDVAGGFAGVEHFALKFDAGGIETRIV